MLCLGEIEYEEGEGELFYMLNNLFRLMKSN